jgi:GTP cyclohydrolase II
MALMPTPEERLARARADLRQGLPVVLSSGAESVIAAAAEPLTDARLADLRPLGPLTVAITDRRAATLKARAYYGDMARLVLPPDADAALVRALADPSRDLDSPMKGPFHEVRGGDAGLVRLALRLAKTAHLLPAVMVAVVPPGVPLPGLTELDPSACALLDAPPLLARVSSARVPLSVAQAGRVHVFRPADGADEHYAVEIGRPDRHVAVLARLHSACFTGDVLGSLKCDCGAQLHTALERIAAEPGGGVLLYLNQEGRGIGLANKLRAYALQDQGFDTVEANHRLGFEDDERDFRLGAEMLRGLGFSQVRLMTNNPAKVRRLESCGIAVAERVPLAVGRNPTNAGYLDVKAKKSGHML